MNTHHSHKNLQPINASRLFSWAILVLDLIVLIKSTTDRDQLCFIRVIDFYIERAGNYGIFINESSFFINSARAVIGIPDLFIIWLIVVVSVAVSLLRIICIHDL